MKTGFKKVVLSLCVAVICLLFTSAQAEATTLDGKAYGVGFQILSPEIAGIGMLIDVGHSKAVADLDPARPRSPIRSSSLGSDPVH